MTKAKVHILNHSWARALVALTLQTSTRTTTTFSTIPGCVGCNGGALVFALIRSISLTRPHRVAKTPSSTSPHGSQNDSRYDIVRTLTSTLPTVEDAAGHITHSSQSLWAIGARNCEVLELSRSALKAQQHSLFETSRNSSYFSNSPRGSPNDLGLHPPELSSSGWRTTLYGSMAGIASAV
ncbi:hypothetical protein EDB86DRAFT_2837264 [Lactarius hatsudake]|nr:hypothetical protein EDB86DRAFT_2837264 [Lactarius hatsudake]